MASKQVYQLYVEQKDYSPKIWRRFEVVRNITVARLGYILMPLFEVQAHDLFWFGLHSAKTTVFVWSINIRRKKLKTHPNFLYGKSSIQEPTSGTEKRTY